MTRQTRRVFVNISVQHVSHAVRTDSETLLKHVKTSLPIHPNIRHGICLFKHANKYFPTRPPAARRTVFTTRMIAIIVPVLRTM